MAEGERFELSTLITQGKRLAGARTRPLCDPSNWHPLLYHNSLFSSKVGEDGYQPSAIGSFICWPLDCLLLTAPCVIIDAMEINVLFDEGFEGVIDEGWLRQVAAKALTAEHQPDAEMGTFITGQDKIRQLHKEYMGEDEPTDVLSFAMREKGLPDTPDFVFPSGDAAHLGEVIISYPQAEMQAAEHGHSTRKEVSILLIHGVLHLLGYDHDVPERQKKMQAREKALLKLIAEGPG